MKDKSECFDIILIQKDGMLDILKKSPNIIIEIRDYDVSDRAGTSIDENGDEYYRRIL